MKKIVVFFMTVNVAFGACVKVDCTATIQTAKQQAITKVQQSYAKNQQAQARLEEAYNRYNEALDKQNELLYKIQTIKKETLLEEKEINAFLKKHNLLRSKNIDIKNNEDF
ncbi:hypothetical protein KDE13_09195 [Campylobacter sp. faydin G-140]|uniref:hypothetical protein n=1 Tax=Campylobacter anatolicus TaxID=2829105 RepID=UPI001B959638|nr:hypothetical protein [Campylobacter anatolicus]MBR8466508.1 hypothetical protein [Campylobacter anatolicus]